MGAAANPGMMGMGMMGVGGMMGMGGMRPPPAQED